VLASEIDLVGTITEVAYDVDDGPYSGCLFYDFEMRLCHTPLDELTENFTDNYGGNTPVLVAAADPLDITAPEEGWWGVPDLEPFEYNGKDNLIIEVRWQDDNESAVWMWAFDSGANRLLFTKPYDGDTGSLTSKINRFRLTLETDTAVEPASLGKVKSSFM
jgi:hypothetical protein